MSRLKLIILPNGKPVLTTEGQLSDDEKRHIAEVWERAQRNDDAIAVMDDCEVIQAVKP